MENINLEEHLGETCKLDGALSPLRYPGGKGVLGDFLTDLIRVNNLTGATYYELYSGAAGAALQLLYNRIVSKIVINDADYRIYSFWYSILHNTYQFLQAIDACNLTIEEWYIQKAIYDNAENEDQFSIGFATFYLNRTNRSGILHKSGPIGGFDQTGNYLIDARFKKVILKDRINRIVHWSKKISVYNLTAESFLENIEEIEKNNNNRFFSI